MASTLHASAIVFEGQGLLILGPSGSGKSSLALELISRGALLVADDRCVTRVTNGRLIVSSPPTIAGQIEARGLGILNAEYAKETTIDLVVDLAIASMERLPSRLTMLIEGVTLPVVYKVENPSFPAFLLQMLRAGRRE